MSARVVRVEVVEDRTAETRSDDGFLAVRRWVLENVYDDGTRGPPYRYDVVERGALDAVVVAAWSRGPTGVGVWLRRCLRPPLLSRRRLHVPLEWPDGEMQIFELPAGLVDPGERGWEGVRAAAARELEEETGLVVSPGEISALGGPFLVSPGVIGEMVFPVAVEVPEDAVASGERTQEEVERGAEIARFPLDEAVGRTLDAKSEVALRRLRESFR